MSRDYQRICQLLDKYQHRSDQVYDALEKKRQEYTRIFERKPRKERAAAHNKVMLGEYQNADTQKHHLREELIRSILRHLIRNPTTREEVIQWALYQEQVRYEDTIRQFVMAQEDTSPGIASASSPDMAQGDPLSPM